MEYAKPEVHLVNAAATAIQKLGKEFNSNPDSSLTKVTEPAYEADE